MRMRSIHTVIVTPDWCRDTGVKFDPAKFIDNCRRAGVADIEFYTKNALGDAFFAYRGRSVARDWVTETRELARKADIVFRAYYNVGIDGRMAKVQPDWVCRDAAGNPKAYADEPAWMWMCIQSPWGKHVLDELRQVQEAIKPDGFWLDLFGGPGSYSGGELDVEKACHCKYCQAAYKQRTGQPMPAESKDTKVRRTIYELSQETRVKLVRDMIAMFRSADPKISIGYNHAGDFWDRMGVADKDRDFQDGVDLYSLEAKPHTQQSFRAKALWTQEHAFEIMTFGNYQRIAPGAATGSWIDWNLIPPAYQEVSGAIVSAHGGRYIIGVNLPPSGEASPGEFENLSSNFHAIEKREPWLSDIESVPNIAVVYDVDSEYAKRSALPGQGIRNDTEGLHNALFDTNFHFDVTHTEFLHPAPHRVLLCGDIVCPSQKISDDIRAFVRNGGLLIASNETSLWNKNSESLKDFAWGDLFGVKFDGFSKFKTANYALLGDEIRGDAPAFPILVTDRVIHVTCTTATPIAEIIYPEAERTKDTFLWPGSPVIHPTDASGRPFATVNSYGKGKVVYIAGPIGNEIANRGDVWLKYLIAQAIRHYAPPLAITVDAPPGISVVLGRKKQFDAAHAVHILSLVNRYGGMILRPGSQSHPKIGPIDVSIPLSVLGHPPTSIETIDADKMEWRVEDDQLRVRIGSIGHHAVLRIS